MLCWTMERSDSSERTSDPLSVAIEGQLSVGEREDDSTESERAAMRRPAMLPERALKIALVYDLPTASVIENNFSTESRGTINCITVLSMKNKGAVSISIWYGTTHETREERSFDGHQSTPETSLCRYVSM